MDRSTATLDGEAVSLTIGLTPCYRELTDRTPGKTTCLGQRLAKLQMKLILATLLLRSDFTLVDKTGKSSIQAPRPNWNDALHCKPASGSCYVAMKRVGRIDLDFSIGGLAFVIYYRKP